MTADKENNYIPLNYHSVGCVCVHTLGEGKPLNF